ncbi:MAG: DUF2203 domain-containing protein [Candidatus Aenigmarchaeota archaeon]|nr:DUF2203 domain-containing protein [Candidatus Aenigmarchaeota archaeon]
MVPKVFTLEEANRLVPALEKAFASVYDLREQLGMVEKDLRNLQDIWGRQLLDPANPDHAQYIALVERKKQAIAQLGLAIRSITNHGCMLKDLQRGLVDFYHERDGDMVFLCWRYGEKQISNWHTLNSGLRERRPIAELEIIKEAGRG